MTSSALRVLIVDDSVPFQEALEDMLATAPGVEVVGAVGHAQEVVPAVRRTQPDVVLMDLHLPGGGGVDATRRLAEAAPHVPVLVLSMQDDARTVRSAIDAGAVGYLVKGPPAASTSCAPWMPCPVVTSSSPGWRPGTHGACSSPKGSLSHCHR